MATLDRMDLTGLQTWAYHGVFDHERRDGQPFLIDVTWWVDMAPIARSDALETTIDYGEVSSLVVEVVQASPLNLIETLAARVGEALLARFPFEYLRVQVHKPQAPLMVGFTDVRSTWQAARTVAAREVVFCLGSNIEPRWDYLQFAVSALIARLDLDRVRVSPVYETVAQSTIVQDDFLNAIVIGVSTLPAPELLRVGLEIEAQAHRTRDVHHGPRTLDIDLICAGDEIWQTPQLTLPHPRAHQRAFVLAPWLDLDPDAVMGRESVADLLAGLTGQEVARVPDDLFHP